jgi:hypothetical protein
MPIKLLLLFALFKYFCAFTQIIHVTVSLQLMVNIKVTPKPVETKKQSKGKLFFINLGGYKENEFNEHHYILLVVADNRQTTSAKAKQTTFTNTLH